jgi:hypothetical protein
MNWFKKKEYFTEEQKINIFWMDAICYLENDIENLKIFMKKVMILREDEMRKLILDNLKDVSIEEIDLKNSELRISLIKKN